MDNKRPYSRILESSNFSQVEGLSEFAGYYIEKLVYNISIYADADCTLGSIELIQGFSCRCELCQTIGGERSACSYIDGRDEVLVAFAESYSQLGIRSFDILAREALLDFLNLNNGLFAVMLSRNNICELSLEAPVQGGSFSVDNAQYRSITVIPVIFQYGTVKFYLCEV